MAEIQDFKKFTFEESRYGRGKFTWMATTLFKAVKEQNLEPFVYPIAGYDMTKIGFQIRNADDYIWHTKRVLNADYDYPIILDDLGQVADGYHRIMHAILDGKESIVAYRLKYMPDADFEDEKGEDE